MDIQKVRLVPRTLEAVHYTEANAEEVRQWVQDNSAFAEVVRDANTGRLFLPTGDGGLEIAEYGEVILHEPGTNSFRVITKAAFDAYYTEVSE